MNYFTMILIAVIVLLVAKFILNLNLRRIIELAINIVLGILILWLLNKFGFDTEILDGLAHYAEHVFFEGTKASDELEIFNLIGQFDEFINAYTSDEETVFQYFGSNYTFDTLLSYISDFIRKPLLNETQFITEINAVNSEYDTYNYTLKVALDILRDNANPNHAFSQTITGHIGNNATLRNYTASELKDFLKNYF